MPLIPFPDVPQLPGVPPLPRLPGLPASSQNFALNSLEGILWRGLQTRFVWGIFDTAGNALADPAKFTGLAGAAVEAAGVLWSSTLSTHAVEYRKEMKISEFPVEAGGFASYNKVEMPANPRVTLAFSGTEADRTAFLTALDTATKSTNLYSIVTPEVRYIGYAIESYDYERRSQKGATLLTVELTLKEIRQVSAQFVKAERPKAPSAEVNANNGKVQPTQPEKSTLVKMQSLFPSLSDTIKGLF